MGIMLFVGAAILSGICAMPRGATWAQIYGLSLLCGIGFTMSLFIGVLAFDDPIIGAQVRLAVLCASGLAAVCGYSVLKYVAPKKELE